MRSTATCRRGSARVVHTLHGRGLANAARERAALRATTELETKVALPHGKGVSRCAVATTFTNQRHVPHMAHTGLVHLGPHRIGAVAEDAGFAWDERRREVLELCEQAKGVQRCK